MWDELENSPVEATKMLIQVAQLRTTFEPELKRRGMLWEDVSPALELVASVAELEGAKRDLPRFLSKPWGAAGKKLAIAQLRPRLEPELRRQRLHWSDVAPALESALIPEPTRNEMQPNTHS